MANQSISQLGVATTPLTGDELTVVVQNGVTKQTQLQDIADLGGPAGPVGPQGPQGPQGIAATIQVQSTTTGAPGTNASVVNTGSLSDVLLDFTIPRGDVGATGATGATGPVGPGVAAGGVAGQYLKKTTSVDYQTTWDTLPVYVNSVAGTENQIDVVDGANDAVLSIASNAVLPGTGAIRLPFGTTAQRSSVSPANGMIRYNTETALFEGFLNGSWTPFASGSGVTSVATGAGLTGGPITSTGTISIDSTVVTLTGTQTLTGKTINGPDNTLTNIGNSSLSNSSVTFNGQTVALGASGTITAASPNALTIGTGLSGTSYDGSSAVTIAIDSTVATLTGTQTLTGKTINGPDNTLTNIANSSLSNSSITLGTTNIALGGTSLTPAGLTSVTVTQNPTADFQLATKQYVDTLAGQGITFHEPVRVESPTPLTATYNNGTAGVGATLTNSGTQAALVIDGVTLVVNDRVLIYTQTDPVENGVYVVTDVGSGSTDWILTRSADTDSFGIQDPNALGYGDYFFVTAGATGAGESYISNTTGTIVFGTTPITFVQFSSAPTYTAGTGLALAGTQFSIANTAVTPAAYGSASSVGTFTVNAQGQLTAAANATISIPASAINTTIPNSGLTNSTITINGSAIALGGSVSVGTVTSITSSTLTVGGTSTVPTVDLTSGIITAGTTGSSTQIPVITVDTYGRVTGLTTAAVGGGTVTSVSGTGTVSGISLSGTVTSSGNLTLGGALDLSAPPAIGGTTPAAITGTTITATTYVGISGGTF